MNDNPPPITDEQAKAIQEVAKTTGTALELVGKAGAYVGEVLGTVPKDLVGVLGGDWLGEVRIRNLARYKERTEELLRARGVTETAPVSPSIAVPLLRAAADESREELQDLWARLLANAMDPSLGSVRQQFIEAVRAMDPPDAVVLNFMRTEGFHQVGIDSDGETIERRHMAAKLGRTDDDLIVSLDHLSTLRLMEHASAGFWRQTPFGRAFMRACYPEGAERE